MENLDTNDLIEQYLNGTLSQTEREAVENRITGDPAFRADVELHRQLHTEFEDPKKLHLRDLMFDITQAPPPPPSVGKSGIFKGIGITLLALLLGWLAWSRLARAPETPPPPPAPPVTNEPVATQDVQSPPNKPEDKKSNQLIAMADPKDFNINPAFESRLSLSGSQSRAVDGSAELKSPRQGANFTPENGRVSIKFQGTAGADSGSEQNPLLLEIYNNQPNPKTLHSLYPTVSASSRATSVWEFSTTAKLPLKPGLYYFNILRQDDGAVVYTGKFTVGAK